MEDDSQTILNLLQKEALSSRKLELLSTFDRDKLTMLLTNLLERDLIEISETNTYKLKTS